MTVAELERRMSVAELRRWALFEEVEPFPSLRIELVAGLICSVLANINRGKNTPAFETLDFMPFVSRALKEASVAERQRTEMPTPDDLADAAMQRAVLMFGGGVHG